MEQKDLEKQFKQKGTVVSDYQSGFNLYKNIIYRKIKKLLPGERARELTARALAFSQTNKDHFVIIGDAAKDKLYLSYGKKFMTIDISSKFLHLNQKIIKRILTKDFENSAIGKKMATESIQEFTHVLYQAVFSFIEHINHKETKVAVEEVKKD